MGHRLLFNSSQIVDTDNDQGSDHDEQAYMLLGRADLPEGNTFGPAERMVIDGGSFASQSNPATREAGYSSSSPNVEIPNNQPQAPGPSHDPYLHVSAAGSFHMVQENYAHHASSSNHGGQTFHGLSGGGVDFTMGNMRGPYKRKSPGVTTVCEGGCMSQYRDAGSSSSIPMPIASWQEKQISDTHITPWDASLSYRDHCLTIHNEGTQRNVRSRTAFDLEPNLVRTQFSINPSHNAITSLLRDHSSSTDVWGRGCSASSTREWNHNLVSPTAHPRTSVSESNVLGHEINHFNVVHSTPGAALQMGRYQSDNAGGYQNDYTLNRSPICQNLQGNLNQSVRGARSSFTQRSPPMYRASSSHLHPGPGPQSDSGLQVVAESHPARRSRPFSAVIVHDRLGRSRISNDRIRSSHDEQVLQHRFPPEGLMIADPSALYGSRSLFDQYRDMRLDIDNMGYEELLALGERIGHVSTGLSDDLISKCLTETIFCSSDQFHEDEVKCVICLEEYMSMDGVGTLKACGHDFHVECVRKWLSMKNLCPICKATSLDDKMKQN